MATVTRGGRQLSSPDVFGQQTAVAQQNAQLAQEQRRLQGKQVLDKLYEEANAAGYSISQLANENPGIFKQAFTDLSGGIDTGGRADAMLQAIQQGPVTYDQMVKWEEDKEDQKAFRNYMKTGEFLGGPQQATQQPQEQQSPKARAGRTIGADFFKDTLSGPTEWNAVFNKAGFSPEGFVDASGNTVPNTSFEDIKEVAPNAAIVWSQEAKDWRNRLAEQTIGKKYDEAGAGELESMAEMLKSGVKEIKTTVEKEAPRNVDPRFNVNIDNIKQVMGEDTALAYETLNKYMGDLKDKDALALDVYLRNKNRDGSLTPETVEQLRDLTGVTLTGDRGVNNYFSSKGLLHVSRLPQGPFLTDPVKTEEVITEESLEFAIPEGEPLAPSPETPKEKKEEYRNIYTFQRGWEQINPSAVTEAKMKFRQNQAALGESTARAVYQTALAQQAVEQLSKVGQALPEGSQSAKTLEEFSTTVFETLGKGGFNKENIQFLETASKTLQKDLQDLPIQWVTMYDSDTDKSELGKLFSERTVVKVPLFDTFNTQQLQNVPGGLNVDEILSKF